MRVLDVRGPFYGMYKCKLAIDVDTECQIITLQTEI